MKIRGTPPKKRTTPAKGEEAEVVVYQPRGVGLIHTRHKSSDAYYTLASARKRKYETAGKATRTGHTKSANTCRELPFCPA